ncbi:uncharacterized protein LOC143852394 [Tasmannia lanceolata]|uniref:uncharacterized protein LOC143852394 n=1 Tax=Tasmannia lanceolata TaxID=3420 RepID=UPI0040631432
MMVLSWLLNAISKDLRDSIIYSDTAAAVWIDLSERFSQGNAAKVYRIRCDIINHHQEQLSVSAYYTKLKALWDELSSYLVLPPCSCGVMKALTEFQLQEKLMQFLMGLNDSFSPIRSQILLMGPLPAANKAYSLVLQEENQRLMRFRYETHVDGTVVVANQAATATIIPSASVVQN